MTVSVYSPILITSYNPNTMNVAVAPIRSTLSPTLSIYKLPGIGRHTPHALQMYGINTIKQFSLFTDKEVTTLLGKSGKRLLVTAKRIAMSKY